MRTVLALTIALALGAPISAGAAGTSPADELSKTAVAYQQLGIVRVIERFDNGAVATVDVMPGQYRIASLGGQDPALIVKLATQPIPDLTGTPAPGYSIKPLGTKLLDTVKVNGYTIASSDGSYVETVWVNADNLPLMADVQTQGHKINLTFGDYNNSSLVARP
jgi:hypothetical protein